MATNALSVDLEEYFQVSNFETLIDRSAWDDLPSRVEVSTERLLDLFDRTAQRSTFFILGWIAERHPKLLRRIAEAGHEIACHGYQHELVYELGPDKFREDLHRSRDAIQQATGHAVVGYRAPSYSITHASLWALRILAEEGFDYDSSIFPIRHHRYGIPTFERMPVHLDLSGGLSIREFPMTTFPVGPWNLPVAGGAYLRFIPGAVFRWAIRHLAGRGNATILYLHPWEVDPEQPRQNVSWKTRINHYFNLAQTESRLDALLRDQPFCPVGQVLEELELAGRLPITNLDRAL